MTKTQQYSLKLGSVHQILILTFISHTHIIGSLPKCNQITMKWFLLPEVRYLNLSSPAPVDSCGIREDQTVHCPLHKHIFGVLDYKVKILWKCNMKYYKSYYKYNCEKHFNVFNIRET